MRAIAWYLGWASLIVLFGMMLDVPHTQVYAQNITLRETFYLSRSCPNGSHWYVESLDQDDLKITLACDYDADDMENAQ